MGEGHEGTVDRVMRAYQIKYKVSDQHAKTVRAEVSKFIDELLHRCAASIYVAGPRRALKPQASPAHPRAT